MSKKCLTPPPPLGLNITRTVTHLLTHTHHHSVNDQRVLTRTTRHLSASFPTFAGVRGIRDRGLQRTTTIIATLDQLEGSGAATKSSCLAPDRLRLASVRYSGGDCRRALCHNHTTTITSPTKISLHPLKYHFTH